MGGYRKEVIKMNTLELMELIETVVETWQIGDIDSAEALEKINELISSFNV